MPLTTAVPVIDPGSDADRDLEDRDTFADITTTSAAGPVTVTTAVAVERHTLLADTDTLLTDTETYRYVRPILFVILSLFLSLSLS